MNYEEFKISAIAALQEHFGDHADVSLRPVLKNNNVQLDGLTIFKDNENISPTIYLNYYYEDYLSGKPLSSIVDDLVKSYQENLLCDHMDFSFFTDYEKVKNRIIYKVIHHNLNQELLKDVPHFRYLDLAIVFCCLMPEMPCGNGSILIHDSHLAFWKIDADELRDIAVKNTPLLLPVDLKSMGDAIKSMCPELFEKENSAQVPQDIPDMYILSNTEKLYGASAMFYPNVLAEFSELADSDLYILPSSIHEVLLLPKDSRSNARDLNCIVKDVNASHVLKEEILSDHVYLFERSNGHLANPSSFV